MGIIKCFNTECRDFTRSEVNNCSRPLTRILECPEAIVRHEKPRAYERPDSRDPGERDRAWYAKELRSNECACGKTKKPGYVFCVNCFYSLPKEKQDDLYLKMGEGYEEAREKADLWLEENVW